MATERCKVAEGADLSTFGTVLSTKMSEPLYFVAFYAKLAWVRRLQMLSDYSQADMLHLIYP